MISVVLGWFTSVIAWLVIHLPASPIRSITLGGGMVGGMTIGEILSWVNFFVPFHQMYLIFMSWLTCAMVFICVKILKKLLVNEPVETISGYSLSGR